MFRTVTVYTGEKISLDGGWMVVSGEKGEQRVPIEDIYSRHRQSEYRPDRTCDHATDGERYSYPRL